MQRIRNVLITQCRFLLFRSARPDLQNHFPDYLAYILIVAWLVGIGRYWDHPAAEVWQYAGLGPLLYAPLYGLSIFLI